MSNKTNADYIRSMNDKELARFLSMLLSRHRAEIIARLYAQGLISDVEISEAPMFSEAAHLQWLREPASIEGGHDHE